MIGTVLISTLLDILALDIFGLDILGLDILGLDIVRRFRKLQSALSLTVLFPSNCAWYLSN